MSFDRPGLSVIVPTWNGAERIPRLLESLRTQTIDPARWEVIFVINGPADGTESLLKRFVEINPHIEARIYFLDGSGAAIARNVGLSTARRSHITFLDDDDYLQPQFLQSALDLCARDQVGLLPMVDEIDGEIIEDTPINIRIKALGISKSPLPTAPWTLGFNASKVVPSSIARRYRYDPKLKSGEDVAYFANLLRHPDLVLRASPAEAESAYVRVRRPNSVSRREANFDFLVAERFDVIKALQAIPLVGTPASARDSLVRSQFAFTERFLRSRPNEVEPAIDQAISRGLQNLSWNEARGGMKPERLVISYCFPPYADPAANVAAKRIAARREAVDVVRADMSSVRGEDSSSLEVARPWIHSITDITVYPAFSAWPLIIQFAEEAMRAVGGHRYKTLYSRAMWSGSHVAALLYKLKYRTVRWEAEFSDPMRFDATGAVREGEITPGATTAKLWHLVNSSPWPNLEFGSHFELTEAATLISADEVTFSNANQQSLVLGQYPGSFREMVERKTRVASQPTPLDGFYKFRRIDLRLALGTVNIGYFGNFYRNRGLGTLLDALADFPREIQVRFALHVFTKNADEIGDALAAGDVDTSVTIHAPLPYLEFLNAAQQFNVLLVVDAATKGTALPSNPFLPSKFSDYVGSRTPIWAMVEEGSPLSSVRVDYLSRLNHVEETKRVLVQLLAGTY